MLWIRGVTPGHLRSFFRNLSRCEVWLLTCLAALGLALVPLASLIAQDSPGTTAQDGPAADQQSIKELQARLCSQTDLDCTYVTSIFSDPRLEVYHAPPPAPEEPPPNNRKEREKNPYLTRRFGLLTAESLDRCRRFTRAHSSAFTAAFKRYGVPREIICGHLRIETNFGIPTRLSPHPLGMRPAFNQLVSLYVKAQEPDSDRRREFAFAEISQFIAAAKKFNWDLFGIPGSPTGAIGLVQFEPSSFGVAVDAAGDGRVDLFDPDDAILSVAHYLVTRGWDRNPEHQRRAIYAYYGGHYDHDPHKYYMKAVLRYAMEVRGRPQHRARPRTGF